MHIFTWVRRVGSAKDSIALNCKLRPAWTQIWVAAICTSKIRTKWILQFGCIMLLLVGCSPLLTIQWYILKKTKRVRGHEKRNLDKPYNTWETLDKLLDLTRVPYFSDNSIMCHTIPGTLGDQFFFFHIHWSLKNVLYIYWKEIIKCKNWFYSFYSNVF